MAKGIAEGAVRIVAPLVSSSQGMSWKNAIERLAREKTLPIFSDVALEFAQQLSQRILQDKSLRIYPEIVSLGYWLRKSHLQEMKERCRAQQGDDVRLPRGLVLAFAPGNIDTMFVYTWILALLAGNSGVVRISGRESEQVGVLLRLLNELLSEERFVLVRQRSLFVQYDHDQTVTEWLSSLCHVRVIWGGDRSVRELRSIPLAPLATELVFPDRFGLAVLSAEAVLQSTAEQELQQLATNFYNDTLFFHQLACSSPRLVCWLGAETIIIDAKERFWKVFRSVIEQKQYKLAPAIHMARLTQGFVQATLDHTVSVSAKDFTLPLCVTVDDFPAALREEHRGAGLFFEYHGQRLEDILPLLADKDQTITYFGVERSVWQSFCMNLRGRSVDRIVPVGQALDFSDIWDGYDLLMYFTRVVQIC